VPADDQGRAGSVAHKAIVSGTQNGKEVEGEIVAVLKIGWDEEEERRIVVTESFVTPLTEA
jgi:hypothetical protein